MFKYEDEEYKIISDSCMNTKAYNKNNELIFSMNYGAFDEKQFINEIVIKTKIYIKKFYIDKLQKEIEELIKEYKKGELDEQE